jgi:hypothetical protein
MFFVVLMAIGLGAWRASAVFEDTSSPEENVTLKVDGEAQAVPPQMLLSKEQERQDAARARAEKIRNLPPEKVKEWAEGRLSEEDLARFAAPAEAPAGDAPAEVAIPRGRMVRLALCGALVVVLGGVLWRRRRLERAAVVAEKRRAV